MIEMTTIFGIPDATVHAMVVELHTGMAAFAFVALVVMVIADLIFRGKAPGEQWKAIRVDADALKAIRVDADAVAYLGSLGAVFFLILSGITGFLILPYSDLSTTPIYLNKSIFALFALFFWAAFSFVRFWFGPGLWKKRGLYVVSFVAALLGMLFTGLAGSLGGEISPYGESVLTPLYNYLGISWQAITLTQDDVYLTLAAMVVILVVVAAVSIRIGKATPLPRSSSAAR